ncbi:MAG: glycerate kinase [Elusimicrobia bacterium]|nr:glycerate kinase [Elusimicrobiota bacterium]
MSALEAARAFKTGVLSALPGSKVEILPISDGGDGLMESLLWSEGGRRIPAWVSGPMGERRQAAFGLLPGGAAVVEMAKASGLALVPPKRRNPLLATSRGTGDLIAAALRRDARTIILGMGGSASSDGGAGMAQALGARLLDARGRELRAGARHLRSLAAIDMGGFLKMDEAAKVVAVSDVENPLLGSRGTARVFGPQKGATPGMVKILEEALSRYAEVIKKDLGISVARIPGSGAAGGLGAGLIAFLGAEIVPGAKWVLARCGADKALARADALMTGEGRLDETSFYGKAPVEIARMAAARGIPSAFVCGQVAARARRRLRPLGVRAAVSFPDAGATELDSLSRAKSWAAKAARIAARSLAPAFALCFLAVAARASQPPPLSRADWLYFHRNQKGSLDECLSDLDALLKANPKDADALWRKGRAMVRAGESLRSRKDKIAEFRTAVGVIRESVALDSADADAHFWLGVAMGRLGQSQGILHSLFLVKPLRREMRTVLAIDPSYSGAYRVFGEMYLQIPGFAGGSVSKGIADLEKSVRLAPDETSNYVALAQAYESDGQKAKAVDVLQQVLKVSNPADPAQAPDDMKQARDMLGKLGAAPSGGSAARR